MYLIHLGKILWMILTLQTSTLGMKYEMNLIKLQKIQILSVEWTKYFASDMHTWRSAELLYLNRKTQCIVLMSCCKWKYFLWQFGFVNKIIFYCFVVWSRASHCTCSLCCCCAQLSGTQKSVGQIQLIFKIVWFSS